MLMYLKVESGTSRCIIFLQIIEEEPIMEKLTTELRQYENPSVI
jgi:hypothetical protein